jgi:hypothetical protein
MEQDENGVDEDKLLQYSFIRRWTIKISTHSDFELGVIMLIFANCITLAMHDPLLPPDSTKNRHLDTAGVLVAARLSHLPPYHRLYRLPSPLLQTRQTAKKEEGQAMLLLVFSTFLSLLPTPCKAAAGNRGTSATAHARSCRPAKDQPLHEHACCHAACRLHRRSEVSICGRRRPVSVQLPVVCSASQTFHFPPPI